MFAYIGNSAEVQLPEVFTTESKLEITGFYTMFKAIRKVKYMSPAECHSAMEMVYVLDGCAGFTSNENIYSLPAGHICFHPTMDFHKLWTEGDKPATIFIISFDLTGNLTHKFKNGVFKLPDREKNFLESIIAYLDAQNPEYSSLFEIDYREFYKETPDILNTAVKMLEAFMTSFAVSHMKAIDQENENMHLYTKIASVLEQSVYTSVSIPEIAKMCGTSPTTVKNTVKNYAGCTVHKFLLKIKMRKAIELLKSGKNVSEISDILGFCNPNYFSQVFFRETGRHASDYK